MAEQLLGLIVDGGKKLVTALKKVKTNKEDAHKLEEHIVLVESVCTDVIPLHDGRRNDPKVMLAMSRLKDALKEAETEVDRYVKGGIFYQFAKVNVMTKKLASLRQDIEKGVNVSVLATVLEMSKDGKDHKHIVQDNNHILQDNNHILQDNNHMLQGLVQSLNQRQLDKDTSVVVAKRVWTQFQLRTRQREATELVSEALFIPFGLAAVLLRHLNWDPERVQDEWRQDGDKLRKAVGLPSSRLGWRPNSDDRRERSSCNICFGAGGSVAAGTTTTMISAGCSHYYCEECWRRYISVAVGEGGLQCLSLRCPDPSCQMPVIEELVDMVALNDKDRERYAMFARWSYVDNSGGRIKWCPGPNCGSAIEFLGGAGAGASSSANNDACCCDLKHSFCWSCGEEPHRPVSCDTACTWLDTITPREDKVLMYTKRCPKCRKLIENLQRTNNMTCSAPCGHRFCWICLHPLAGSNHRTATCIRYRYMAEITLQVYGTDLQGAAFERERQAMLTTKKEEHHKAVASPHYEQWVANQASLKVVLEEMDALKKNSVLSNMAASLGVDVADLNFFAQAYEEMSECRRVILWSYPYCYYYLDPKRDDGDKWQLLELLVKEANDSLKSLRDLVAEENMLSLYNYDEDVREACEAFKTEVRDSTAKMRHKVEKLVKAVETQFVYFS